jgi:hypothetical protein
LEYFKKNLEPLEKKYSDLWKFPVDLSQLDDTLRARFCHKFDLPPMMDEADADHIMHSISALENMLYDSFHVQQLSIGSFFGDWLTNLEMEPLPKMVLYSNHDSTLRAILSALGIFDDVWPPYASHVALELWEELVSGKKFVVMQYDGKTRKMKEPCEEEFCLLENFQKLLNSYRTELCDEPSGSLNLHLEEERPTPRFDLFFLFLFFFFFFFPYRLNPDKANLDMLDNE